MAHSNRKRLHWGFIVSEVLLFIVTVGISSYFSETHEWVSFVIIIGVSAGLFTTLKVFEARPALQELLVREELASTVASGLLVYGVNQYFNMQIADDQVRRNKLTQDESPRVPWRLFGLSQATTVEA
jgi:hypothetical protein